MGRDSAGVVTWTGSGRGQGGGIKRWGEGVELRGGVRGWGERSEKTAVCMKLLFTQINAHFYSRLLQQRNIEALAKFGSKLRWYHT